VTHPALPESPPLPLVVPLVPAGSVGLVLVEGWLAGFVAVVADGRGDLLGVALAEVVADAVGRAVIGTGCQLLASGFTLPQPASAATTIAPTMIAPAVIGRQRRE